MTDRPEVGSTTGRRLLALVAEAQVAGRLPSLVAGLTRGGCRIWMGGYGDIPGPMGDVHYRVGSITKTMTAVAVLQAVRDGCLDLDAPASAVLGDSGYGSLTSRQLLAHNGGMQSEPTGPWWERSAGVAFTDLLAANTGDGAVFDPGTRFHYSNLGYALLGEMVARVRGTTWWDWIRSAILLPLQMTRTGVHPEAPVATGFSVHPYARTLTEEPATDTGAMAPAGQLWSTVTDLLTWADFLLSGHPAVLDRDWLELARHPQSGDHHHLLGYAHGLGFQLIAGGSGMLVGHTGSMPGFQAGCFVDPGRGAGGVVLANSTRGLAASELINALLAEVQRSEPALPPPWRPTRSVPEEFEPTLGLWHWGNTPFVFGVDGEQLVASRDGVPCERFVRRDGRVVGIAGYHAGEELRVIRDPEHQVSHLEIATFVYTRIPYDPDGPVPR